MSEAKIELVCAKCGCIIDDAESAVYADGYCYCPECAEANVMECEKCGELHRMDLLYNVISEGGESQRWCEDCYDNHSFYCDCCQQAYDSDYYETRPVESGGGTEMWCEDCADSYAVLCEDCGDLVNEDDMVKIEDTGNYVCPRCADNYYYRCDDCGRYFEGEDSLYTDPNGYHRICESCAESSWYWHYCESCNNYVHDSDWDEAFGACCDCAHHSRRSSNARVRDYHGDPEIVYFGENACNPRKFIGCGIELEIDRETPNGREKQALLNELDELFEDHGYYKYDGSLRNGFEIVTQPHTIDEFYQLPWKEVLKACLDHGFVSHEMGTCGLHMHVSRNMFGDDEETQSDNIAKLMQFYEMYWSDIVKISRRTPEQVQDWARRYHQFRKETLKNYAKRKDCCERYMAVNVTNSATVEIRINRGTLKLKTFLATCDFILTTCQNSCNIDWADVSDDFQWLDGLERDTLEYLNERCAFNEPVWKRLNAIRDEEYRRAIAEQAEATAHQTDTGAFRRWTPLVDLPRVSVEPDFSIEPNFDVREIEELMSGLQF